MHLHNFKKRFITFICFLYFVYPATTQAEAVIEGKNGWLFAGWEKLDAYPKQAVDHNLTLIADVHRQLKQHGIDLVIMVVPTKAVLYKHYLPDTVQLPPDVKNAYSTVIQQLHQYQIVTFDGSTILNQMINNQQDVFLRTDYHWTALAAEAFAQATADTIRQSIGIPQSSSSGEHLGEWSNARYYGDLATHFLTEKDRKRIGKDLFTVRKPVTNDVSSLLDDEPPRIEVVGNSFVQPYFGYSQKLSNTLNQSVGLTWNSGDHSSWYTFLQALQKNDIGERKIIVWQWNLDRLAASADSKEAWVADSVMSENDWKSSVKQALDKLKTTQNGQ